MPMIASPSFAHLTSLRFTVDWDPSFGFTRHGGDPWALLTALTSLVSITVRDQTAEPVMGLGTRLCRAIAALPHIRTVRIARSTLVRGWHDHHGALRLLTDLPLLPSYITSLSLFLPPYDGDPEYPPTLYADGSWHEVTLLLLAKTALTHLGIPSLVSDDALAKLVELPHLRSLHHVRVVFLDAHFPVPEPYRSLRVCPGVALRDLSMYCLSRAVVPVLYCLPTLEKLEVHIENPAATLTSNHPIALPAPLTHHLSTFRLSWLGVDVLDRCPADADTIFKQIDLPLLRNLSLAHHRLSAKITPAMILDLIARLREHPYEVL